MKVIYFWGPGAARKGEQRAEELSDKVLQVNPIAGMDKFTVSCILKAFRTKQKKVRTHRSGWHKAAMLVHQFPDCSIRVDIPSQQPDEPDEMYQLRMYCTQKSKEVAELAQMPWPTCNVREVLQFIDSKELYGFKFPSVAFLVLTGSESPAEIANNHPYSGGAELVSRFSEVHRCFDDDHSGGDGNKKITGLGRTFLVLLCIWAALQLAIQCLA